MLTVKRIFLGLMMSLGAATFAAENNVKTVDNFSPAIGPSTQAPLAGSTYRGAPAAYFQAGESCEAFDSNDINSCAYRNRLNLSAVTWNASAVATKIQADIGATSPPSTTLITNFSHTYCNGGSVNYGISSVRVQGKLIYETPGTMCQSYSDVTASYFTSKLQPKISAAESDFTNSIIPNMTTRYQTTTNEAMAKNYGIIYCPTDVAESTTEAYFQAKTGASKSAFATKVNAGHASQGCTDIEELTNGVCAFDKQEFIPICATPGTVSFENDSVTIDPTQWASNTASATCYQNAKTNQQYLTGITITTNANTLNNTKGAATSFCRKGFLGLSQARGISIANKLISDMGLSCTGPTAADKNSCGTYSCTAGSKTFTISLNCAGENQGDGTVGPCAYSCTGATNSVCNESAVSSVTVNGQTYTGSASINTGLQSLLVSKVTFSLSGPITAQTSGAHCQILAIRQCKQFKLTCAAATANLGLKSQIK